MLPPAIVAPAIVDGRNFASPFTFCVAFWPVVADPATWYSALTLVSAPGIFSSRGIFLRSTCRSWPLTSKGIVRDFARASPKSGSVTRPLAVALAP